MAITQPTISEATADATQDTTDAGTGIKYVGHGALPTDSPKLRTLLTQQAQQLAKAIEGVLGGWVFDRENGLAVGVKGLKFRLGATEYTLADDDSFTCTDDRVNYLYCDASLIVEEAAAWPGTDHYKLAVVTCASGQVTTIVQARHLNHTIGIDSAWSTFAAVQTVDMATYGLEDLGQLELTAPSELVVSSGSITVTKPWHTVDGEGDAADNLDTLAAAGTGPRLVILSLDPSAEGARTVTVRHGIGNLFMPSGQNHTLGLAEDSIAFLRMPASTDWVELYRNPIGSVFLTDIDLNASGVGIKRCNHLGGSFSPSQQITTGNVARTSMIVALRNEADAAEDDLDTMTSSYSEMTQPGEIVFLTNRQSGPAQTTHIKHAASGAGKFFLLNGKDCDVSATAWLLVVRGYTDSDMWFEIARSPIDIKHLAGTSKCIPFEQTIRIAGALSAGVDETWLYVKNAFTLISATGVVAVGPTGASEVIDVQVDPGGDGTGFVTIFASGAERINILDGTVKDTSAKKDHAVAAGSLIRIEITTHTASAADLTVVLHGQIAVQSVP